MHRVLDLAILICRAKKYFSEAYRYENFYDEDNPRIDRIGLQGDAMSVDICTDNPMIKEDIKLFMDILSQDDELLGERLVVLANMLKELGYAR